MLTYSRTRTHLLLAGNDTVPISMWHGEVCAAPSVIWFVHVFFQQHFLRSLSTETDSLKTFPHDYGPAQFTGKCAISRSVFWKICPI